MDLSTVDVVIVAHGDEPLLRRAVRSTLSSVGVDVHVVVVDLDNDPHLSGAHSPFRTEFARDAVSVVPIEGSRGFAHARNMGIAAGSAPSVLVLGVNHAVRPNTIRTLLDQLDGDVAVAAPVVSGAEPEDTAGRAWTLSAAVRRHGATARPRPLAAPREQVWSVDYASGCCLLIERAVWESVGGFDETFSHGPDDLDFCLRVRASRRGLVQVRAAIAERTGANTTASTFSLDGARQRIDTARTVRRHRSLSA